MSNNLSNKIKRTDLVDVGKEVLDENDTADFEVFAKLEALIENKKISIAIEDAKDEFVKNIESIKPGNVEELAKTQLDNQEEIAKNRGKIGSLTIAFAMMLEESMRKSGGASRPKTVEEILLENSGMKGAKQIMDILNFEKTDKNMIGGALYAGLNALTDTYNSEMVGRSGLQRAVVGVGTAGVVKALGFSGSVAVLSGLGMNVFTEWFAGNGDGYEKTSQKKGLAALSQSVFDTGNLMLDSVVGGNSKTSFSLRGIKRSVSSAFNNFKRGHTPGETAFAGVALGVVGGLATWLGYKGFKALGAKKEGEGETKNLKDYIVPALLAISTGVGGAVLGKDAREVSIENKGNVKNVISVEESEWGPYILSGVFTGLFGSSMLINRYLSFTELDRDELKNFVQSKIENNNMSSQQEVIIKIGDKKTIKYTKKNKTYEIMHDDYPDVKYKITDDVNVIKIFKKSNGVWQETESLPLS